MSMMMMILRLKFRQLDTWPCLLRSNCLFSPRKQNKHIWVKLLQTELECPVKWSSQPAVQCEAIWNKKCILKTFGVIYIFRGVGMNEIDSRYWLLSFERDGARIVSIVEEEIAFFTRRRRIIIILLLFFIRNDSIYDENLSVYACSS